MFTTTSATGYTCSCTALFTGSNCQFNNPCGSSPCLNKGVCTALEEGNDSYLCECQAGFIGDRCEQAVICQDENETLCKRLAARCENGIVFNQSVKDYCPKTCKICT